MTNSTSKTPRELAVERGRDIVIAMIVLFALLEGLGLTFKIVDKKLISIVDLIRFSITTILCVYLYKGHDWAKLLLGFSATLGMFIHLYTLYIVAASPTAGFSLFFPILLLTTLYAMAAYYLILSSEVNEFLKSQKNSH